MADMFDYKWDHPKVEVSSSNISMEVDAYEATSRRMVIENANLKLDESNCGTEFGDLGLTTSGITPRLKFLAQISRWRQLDSADITFQQISLHMSVKKYTHLSGSANLPAIESFTAFCKTLRRIRIKYVCIRLQQQREFGTDLILQEKLNQIMMEKMKDARSERKSSTWDIEWEKGR
nr:hypothetical protein [Tanacetum cinerariifolium]